MRVAVVGGGVSGLVSAYVLAIDGVEVVVYEKEDTLGGHAKTVAVDATVVDLGFMVFSRVTCPDMMKLFESLGVDKELSDMSFSVSLNEGRGCEWGTRNGLSSLFAQKKNVVNPCFWKMIREIIKFKDDAATYLEELENNPNIDRNDTLGHFVQSHDSDLCFYLVMLFRSNELLCLFHTFIFVQSPHSGGCAITCMDGTEEVYDGCIIATHAPDALKMLGKQATYDELRILGAFQYVYSDIFLHHDNNLMPKNPAAWSSRNFLGTIDNKAYTTYWLNNIQNIGETGLPFLLTLNPPRKPKIPCLSGQLATQSHQLLHPKLHLNSISSKERGDYGSVGHIKVHSKSLQAFSVVHYVEYLLVYADLMVFLVLHFFSGYGFPEDGVKSNELFSLFLDETMTYTCAIFQTQGEDLKNAQLRKTHILIEKARINKEHHILEFGCGWGNLALEVVKRTGCKYTGITLSEKQLQYVELKVKEAGLQDQIELLLCDYRELPKSYKYDRIIASGMMEAVGHEFMEEFFRCCNTLTQARQNISQHYDLSNELFSLFLDETMTYSCAIFQSQGEDLKNAQLRKIRMLIEKARINKEHHILEIGCGWGSLAFEVVKRTGCKYTGITLGMIESVGHEFMEEFFRCCESALAENGLLVLQFISIADEKYDESRLSPGFIKEYIFPGGSLLSLSRVISAMAAASRLSVVHLEEIGSHYFDTLRRWRQNFLQNQSQVLALGFDEKFIRTWEYYFDYCAAGFKFCILGDYQIVFSRPGDVAGFGNDPYNAVPSAC
ncbi:hypothetical protein Pfo_026469 [Paulownia fortunei]|nr:hypothetical protein Pfo_026469 [Paulownia fortunei]